MSQSDPLGNIGLDDAADYLLEGIRASMYGLNVVVAARYLRVGPTVSTQPTEVEISSAQYVLDRLVERGDVTSIQPASTLNPHRLYNAPRRPVSITADVATAAYGPAPLGYRGKRRAT